jgi:hypothetical protein
MYQKRLRLLRRSRASAAAAGSQSAATSATGSLLGTSIIVPGLDRPGTLLCNGAPCSRVAHACGVWQPSEQLDHGVAEKWWITSFKPVTPSERFHDCKLNR